MVPQGELAAYLAHDPVPCVFSQGGSQCIHCAGRAGHDAEGVNACTSTPRPPDATYTKAYMLKVSMPAPTQPWLTV